MTLPESIACPEAERAVLGVLLQLPARRVLDVLQGLLSDDFADPRRRVVLKAVLDVALTGVDPDPVTVLGELRRTGLERALSADRQAAVFLIDLVNACPLAASVAQYQRVVREHAYRRRVQETAVRLQQAAPGMALDRLRELVGAQTAALGVTYERCAVTAPRHLEVAG